MFILWYFSIVIGKVATDDTVVYAADLEDQDIDVEEED